MIDAYVGLEKKINSLKLIDEVGGLTKYAVMTLHRPGNVDNEIRMEKIISEIISASNDIQFIFPMHPRTKASLERRGMLSRFKSIDTIKIVDPLSYIEFMRLVKGSSLVLTDSGGVQEETTYLGIPCLTLRENTERPITIIEGSNRLVKIGDIKTSIAKILNLRQKEYKRPKFWDGSAANRIVKSLKNLYE